MTAKGIITPKQGDPVFENVQNLIVAGNQEALRAAGKKAESLGYNTLILSSRFEGETRDVARFHACVAREVTASGNPVRAPACILSGGETTVTLTGKGLGGRNQEFAMASVSALGGHRGHRAAFGRDGWYRRPHRCCRCYNGQYDF